MCIWFQSVPGAEVCPELAPPAFLPYLDTGQCLGGAEPWGPAVADLMKPVHRFAPGKEWVSGDHWMNWCDWSHHCLSMQLESTPGLHREARRRANGLSAGEWDGGMSPA